MIRIETVLANAAASEVLALHAKAGGHYSRE